MRVIFLLASSLFCQCNSYRHASSSLYDKVFSTFDVELNVVCNYQYNTIINIIQTLTGLDWVWWVLPPLVLSCKCFYKWTPTTEFVIFINDNNETWKKMIMKTP